MKSSIHLFYGIIIGVFAILCMGLNKEEAKQFKEMQVVVLQDNRIEHPESRRNSKKYIYSWIVDPDLIKKGWTVIDWKTGPGTTITAGHWALIGR